MLPITRNSFLTRTLLLWCTGLAGIGMMVGATLQVNAAPEAGGRAEAAPLLIQGRVTEVNGALVMVRTPNHGPGLNPPRGRVHSMAIMAGRIYKVDTAGAVFQGPEGLPSNGEKLAVGDRVVMILQGPLPKQPNEAIPYHAQVIEHTVDSPAPEPAVPARPGS